jgi:hypothetical protein
MIDDDVNGAQGGRLYVGRFVKTMLTNVAPGLVPGGHIAYVYVRQRGLYVWYLRISWTFWFFVHIHRADHTMNSPPGTRPRRYVGERSRFEQAMCLPCFTYYRVVA